MTCFLANRNRTLALDFTKLFAHLRGMSAPISDISRPTAAFWLLFALFVGSTAPPPFLRLPSDRDLFCRRPTARPSRRGFQPDRRPARARGDRPTRRGLIVAKTTRIRIIIQGVRPSASASALSISRAKTNTLPQAEQRQGWSGGMLTCTCKIVWVLDLPPCPPFKVIHLSPPFGGNLNV